MVVVVVGPVRSRGEVVDRGSTSSSRTAGVENLQCADGWRRTDLSPIVKHQQRAICTATTAEMRDTHTQTHTHTHSHTHTDTDTAHKGIGWGRERNVGDLESVRKYKQLINGGGGRES